ncbi:MAG TPA: ABC transporter ATP-binding protein [Myxococcales bacterium]|nr:ABC transporter ATP-binding protein [Myxococcales bacterium]
MIQVVDVWRSFGDNQVLRGVNLTVEQGTTTVILGGSGSGKSVLMKHMIGLLKPDRGEVIIDGEHIEHLGERDLQRVRQKFGMVFQAAALFDSMTVFENVAFPLRERTKLSEHEIADVVHAKLAVVGLRGIDDRYPDELSGGMRKRVGLARALALEPKIVLYDEPTTGLDPITTDYVDEMILAAKAKLGVTSVVISHDIGSAFKIADRLAVLYEGVIVADGLPAEVRESRQPFVRQLFALWNQKA